MTARISLALGALLGVFFVLAAAPLGLTMTRGAVSDFHGDTVSAARSTAATAEERLGDRRPPAQLHRSVMASARRGERIVVYDGAGRAIARDTRSGVPRSLVRAALRSGRAGTRTTSGRQLVVVPVTGDETPGAKVIGAVALSRSTAPLTHRLHVLWGWLGLVAAGGLGAAVLLAVLLARWVSGPLTALDRAVSRLGEGDLTARSADRRGPPEVRRLALSFDAMAARLEALVHDHRTMTADVSHQLRTPLAALRLRLDLLAADADAESACELRDAQGEVARLSRLVDGLLAVARAESSVPKPVRVRLDEVARERVEAWRPVARERDVTVSAAAACATYSALGDGDLEQILDNLVANALDAALPGGHVHLDTEPTPSGAGVRVSDDGPGMSPAQRERAFRRFATSSPSGTGLGLAIVHRLVTANGGVISLRETTGGGLTVDIEFPAARRSAADGAADRRSARSRPS